MIVHSRLDHPNIVPILAGFVLNQKVYRVMPLLGTFDEIFQFTTQSLYELADALDYLDQIKVCHNDIKPTNIARCR